MKKFLLLVVSAFVACALSVSARAIEGCGCVAPAPCCTVIEEEVPYTVNVPVWTDQEVTYTVCVPVVEQKEITYTVCVPKTVVREGVCKVMKRVPVTEVIDVTVKTCVLETFEVPIVTSCRCKMGCGRFGFKHGRFCAPVSVCAAPCACADPCACAAPCTCAAVKGCGCAAPTKATFQRMVPVINTIQKEVTKWVCQEVEVPYTYNETVYEKEVCTKTFSVVKMVPEQRVKTIRVCTLHAETRSQIVKKIVPATGCGCGRGCFGFKRAVIGCVPATGCCAGTEATPENVAPEK